MKGDSSGYHQHLPQYLLKLVKHSLWANCLWVEFVYSHESSENRPRELLAHLMVGERVWFERIEGNQKTTEMFPSFEKAELIQGFTQNAETFGRLIATRLEDDIRFRRGTGEEYHALVVDIIQHLLTHGYHHRGQLSAHYARLGVQYPNTDHINYLIEQKL